MKLVQRLEEAPYNCWSCKKDNARWFIDTRRMTQFEGKIYICRDCFFGIVPQTKELFTLEQVQKLLRESTNLYEEAKATVERQTKLVNEMLGRFKTVKGIVDATIESNQ